MEAIPVLYSTVPGTGTVRSSVLVVTRSPALPGIGVRFVWGLWGSGRLKCDVSLYLVSALWGSCLLVHHKCELLRHTLRISGSI